LNSIISTANVQINTVKMSCASQDVMDIILKTVDQNSISKYNQTTPSLVDKRYGMFADAATNTAVNLDRVPYSSNPLSGADIEMYDSNVSPRGSFNTEYRVFYRATAAGNLLIELPATATGFDTVVPGSRVFKAKALAADVVGERYYIQCKIKVLEGIVGLDPLENFSPNEAALLGVRDFELHLQLNDCRKIFNDFSGRALSIVKGGVHPDITGLYDRAPTDIPMRDDKTKLVTHQMSIHTSDFVKVKAKNTIPVLQWLNQPNSIETFTAAVGNTQTVLSKDLNLQFIPDKIYVKVILPFSKQHQHYSNSLGYPIENIKVNFNNVPNKLADRSQSDLYYMSRENGVIQSYDEFSGAISTRLKNDMLGLGSIICIDPVSNLDLADYLSSGSIGSFSMQIEVTFKNSFQYKGANTVAGSNQYQLVIVTSKSDILTTQQGMSYLSIPTITKVDVLKAKEGQSDMDYEDLNQLSGGSKPIALNKVGESMRKAANFTKSAKKCADNMEGKGYNLSGGASASSALEKYM